MNPSSAAHPELELRLLGEVTLLQNGRKCALPASKKTRALLGYLIARGRPESRARICELLWDGPDDPRGGLRWSLSKLRALVDGAGAQRLRANREQVEFEPLGAEIDLLAVRALVARGVTEATRDELVASVARFRGRFLEGLELPNCVHFYAWCVAEREAVRGIEVRLLTELITRFASQPDEALRYARALVTLDPLAEASHLRLVRLLADAGRIRDALVECERCRHILASEIGARPSAELEKLRYQLTQRGPVAPEPTLPAPPAPSPEGPASRRFPLFGRSVARARVQELLQGAKQPGAHALLFLGEPGVGKSRMLEELGEAVRGASGRVLFGRAYEAEVVRPYGPFIDALGPSAFELPSGANSALSDRPLLFESVRLFIETLARETSTLALVVDDVQWLDEASAALLHYLARELASSGVVLALAARPGELADAPAVLRALRALEREGQLCRIALEPLDEDTTRALVEAAAPGLDAARIYRESLGNPLFVLELSRALADGNAELPDGVVTLIQERLERFDDEVRATLSWCAAFGRSFDPELLLRVSGVAGTTALGALETLERHGVLKASDARNYDFVHDLVRRAAYGCMSEPRRRLIHAQIARAFEREPDPSGALAGDLLHHAALAGDHELSARACIAAGARCIRLFAYADARDLARRGLDHVRQLGPGMRLPLEVDLLELTLQRSVRRDDADGLEAQLSAVILDASEQGLDELVVRAFELRGQLRYGVQDRLGAAENSLRALEVVRSEGHAGTVRVLAAARCLAHLERDIPKVEACLLEATRVLGPGSGEVDYVWTRALLLRYRGDHGAAARDLERVLSEHRRHGRHWQVCWSLRDIVLNELERGEPRQALTHLAELRQVSERMGDGVERPLAAALTTLAHIALGETGAWGELGAVLGGVRRADGKAMLSVCENFAGEFALAEQRHAQAAAHAELALQAAGAVRYESQVALARATLARAAVARAQPERAREALAGLYADAAEPLRYSTHASRALSRARECVTLSLASAPAPPRRRAER